ncbi:hypothetical protein ACE2AJ_16685 [Aquihabitans daechungensis]|uniref:hypothetical protein n=1 Tax=Aquihabitans daechungensis TaxID=1052257 RepID=UPI003BA39011
MAAPEFVPLKPNDRVRNYSSPPRRDDAWHPVRPGELVTNGGQPDSDAGRMGAPGPDQGYVLSLVPLLRPELQVTGAEQVADVEAGGVAVALKRASLFGRAPVVHDLRVAYTVWGFLDASAPSELVAERTARFEGVHLTAHHYPELRAVADAVPEATLRLSPAEAARQHAADWRSLLAL